MTKYVLEIEIDEGVTKDNEPRTEEQLIKYLQLTTQQALTRAECIIHSVKVRTGAAARSASGPRTTGTPGRKPINRPKIERWIRENIVAAPSTQGTVGLEGVDREGKPLNKVARNRVYIHMLAAPEPEGVGLSLPAIQKVLSELEVEGYLERGFARGAPFYELIRPLEEEGKVGVRGRPIDDMGATPRDVDFGDLD